MPKQVPIKVWELHFRRTSLTSFFLGTLHLRLLANRVIVSTKSWELHFNGIYRRAVLDAWCFLSLSHVREETERWRVEYNTIRPHQSLGDVSPGFYPSFTDSLKAT